MMVCLVFLKRLEEERLFNVERMNTSGRDLQTKQQAPAVNAVISSFIIILTDHMDNGLMTNLLLDS